VGIDSINVPAEPIPPELELPGKQPGPAADSVWQAQGSQADVLAAVASGQFRKVGSASSF